MVSALLAGAPTTSGAGSTGIDSCTTISEPGTYDLTGDISNESATTCLHVTASDVVIDGNGHTVHGTHAEDELRTSAGIEIDDGPAGVDADESTTVSNVTVRDVRVTGWDTGVRATYASDVRLENVTRVDGAAPDSAGTTGRLRGGAIFVKNATGVTITHSTVADTPKGIDVAKSADVTVADTTVDNVTFTPGISFWDTAGEVRVVRNELTNLTRGGTDVGTRRATRVTIADNVITRTGTGVTVSGSANATVVGNELRGNENGVSVVQSRNVVVRENAVSGFSTSGIRVVGAQTGLDSANVTVAGNDIDQTGSVTVAAIYVDYTTDAAVRSNAVTDGTIEFGESVVDSTIAANDVSGGEIGVALHDSTLENVSVRENHVRNATVGIDLVSRTPEGTVIVDNALENGETGVRVAITQTGAGTTAIQGNTITEFSDAGIAVDNSTGTLSVTNNAITDNGDGVRVGDKTRTTEDGDGCTFVTSDAGAETVELHRNRIAGNADYGVYNQDNDAVNATQNFWGAGDGPSSPDDEDAPFEDPETGALADGSGDAVSEGGTSGVANVRFDPWTSTEMVADAAQNESA
ncbi:right-handed parallel beta-helix repeat-containing protein [Halobacteriaceae archaeon GCM10025711]